MIIATQGFPWYLQVTLLDSCLNCITHKDFYIIWISPILVLTVVDEFLVLTVFDEFLVRMESQIN